MPQLALAKCPEVAKFSRHVTFSRLGLWVSSFTLLFLSLSAHASPSFLFGDGAHKTFGSVAVTNSISYAGELTDAYRDDFIEISDEFGEERATPLKILIKDTWSKTDEAIEFVEALSTEKAKLMLLYRLSNRDYNRLAAMAFGILGRETRFGQSAKYVLKEQNQLAILMMKRLWYWRWDMKNSRGLTQIKTVPAKIAKAYCIKNPRQLRKARLAAVATVGFLAESLAYTKYRALKLRLSYIDAENVYDYASYVYFGSLGQLVEPIYDSHGKQLNKTATPSENRYLQHMREHISGLSFLEQAGVPLTISRAAFRNNACSSK